jgi:hypothetical protein
VELRASPEHKDLVGMPVDRIGDRTPHELLRKIDSIISQDNEMMPLMIGPELMPYPRIRLGPDPKP